MYALHCKFYKCPNGHADCWGSKREEEPTLIDIRMVWENSSFVQIIFSLQEDTLGSELDYPGWFLSNGPTLGQHWIQEGHFLCMLLMAMWHSLDSNIQVIVVFIVRVQIWLLCERNNYWLKSRLLEANPLMGEFAVFCIGGRAPENGICQWKEKIPVYYSWI